MNDEVTLIKQSIRGCITKLEDLMDQERIALRRNCGKELQEVDGNTMMAFYKVVSEIPEGRIYDVEKLFPMICFCCRYGGTDHGTQRFEECLRKMINREDVGTTVEKRLKKLLSMKYEKDGIFSLEIWRMIDFISKKESLDEVNWIEFGLDLICWNSDTKAVQKRWISTCYAKKKEEK